jgi:hypothetical protein
LVRTAFLAAVERALGLRALAALLAWRDNARGLAAAWPSRFKAWLLAAERRLLVALLDGALVLADVPLRLRVAVWPLRLAAVFFVADLPLLAAFFAGTFTPARRAFDNPIAMACLAERAPCLPSRTCSISSWTNSPACVLGALP